MQLWPRCIIDKSMPVHILSTKLYCPAVHENLVSRQRLVEQLNIGLKKPLTLISAPAGYGKSTLLSEWRASPTGQSHQLAWLSLDPDDNEPVQFLAYLIAAIRSVKPGYADTLLSSIQAPQLAPPLVILTNLINELSQLDKPLVLVLDDYHVINTPEVHEDMAFILDHAPIHLHLVILTRADPPLQLARLRARNLMYEIRSSDLRFTYSEAEMFLKKIMGLELSEEDVKVLERCTEGWAAGLQLAALSIRAQRSVEGFITALDGSDRFIVDYLAEEVLARQTDTVREFLLKTSILDRMTASLCEAITGLHNCQEMLEKLDRDNLFVIPLDNERQWYRYHSLFSTVLRAYLGRLHPKSIPNLQQRVSEWFADHGFVEEAIHYALAASDFSRAADMIEGIAWTWLNQGKVFNLLKWTALLPDEQVVTRPNLGIVYVWALFISGKEDQMVPRLQQIEGSLSKQEGGEVTLLRAIGARWRGHVKESLLLTKQAINQLPENQSLLIGQAWFNLGMLYRGINVVKAQQAFGRSYATNEYRKDIQGALKALFHQGTMFIFQGSLNRASVVFKHAVELSKELPYCNGAGFARFGMAELNFEWNDLATAAGLLDEVNKLAQDGEMDELHFDTVLELARIHRIREKWLEAQAMLDLGERLVNQAVQSAQMRVHSFLTIPVMHEQVCLWIRQGKKDLITSISEAWPVVESVPLHYRLTQLTTQARIHIYRQEFSPALAVLDVALHLANEAKMAGLSIRVLRSIAYFLTSEIEHALSEIREVLALAEPEGYIRVFLDEGEPMENLLRHAASKGIHPAYIRKILSSAAPATEGIKPTQPLIEPLSERELEILRKVAAGKSNQQVAEDLFLAVGTVKRHLSNIFGKLNVQSRTECIARSRELNLLD